MQVQHNDVQIPRSVQAEVARQLLQANLAYGESNSNGLPFGQRLKARHECREYLQQALELDAENAGALGLLGRVEMDDGQLEKAHTLFNASLNSQPGQTQQYANLGYWALKSERPALAEEYFLKALQCDRQSAAAFGGIAHAKRLQGQYDVAYLHYRSLLRAGTECDSIYAGMLTCAQHLDVHQANAELAQDAIALLHKDGLPHQEIGHFIGAIIEYEYDLNNPNAQVSLEAAAEDELLILALKKTLMSSAGVEELVALLRRAILAEVSEHASLRDELQQLCLAIGEYADRTGHALPAEDDEAQLANTINDNIMAQFAAGESQEDLIGSLMISAMYGALFHQDFAMQLGQWSLMDWPLGMQPLMAASYCNRAEEEAIKQNFDEKAEELCLAKIDVPQAWPAWSQLAYRTETSLRTVMQQELGLATDDLPGTLRLLICGAQSGQHAMELAQHLDDVEIIAVDESLANVAKGTRMAQELGMDNIVFWPWSIAQRFVLDGHQVHWVEVGRLPSPAMTDLSLAKLVNSASTAGAVVHMHTAMAEQTAGDRQVRQLIQDHSLQPTRNNLRQLRRMVLAERHETKWKELLQEDDFYSLGGCRDRWFRPQDGEQLQNLLAMVSNEVDWKLVKARDEDGHSLATAPVQRQIQAEALGSEVQSLLGQDVSVYFQRRR